MIEFKNISLNFDNKPVFVDFSAKIEINQHTCFAGASGKGKSTILKLIQGYVLPQKGEIAVHGLGLNAENIAAVRSQLAYIPQNIHLPVDNGSDLVKMLGFESKHDLILDYCSQMGLEKEFYTRKFDQMSGGQKQRLIVAVCLSLERQIILMDEPTASLDAESTEELLKVIRNLKNKTIVSASHNPVWIESADKIINL
ncbi:MAG TPA: ABC transporter ATP-binding protein [Bacteroidales bacterium]|nr:ABC transporter ATP-binding protein [Bacteroidales bacterium]